jgi:methylglutaconyl-CoA hydratase
VRNAFNDALIAELTAWGESAGGANAPRVAVLSGSGPVFSAGADLTWMAAAARYTHEQNLADAANAARLFETLDRVPFPLIGRIHGAALGGGAGLVAVCDVAIAADDTTFGFTEVRLGILPAVIAPYVVSKIGASAARDLFLTGERFDAQRALGVGLVHRVHPADDLDAAVDRCVASILAAGPEAVAAAKLLIRDVVDRAPAEVITRTTEAIANRRVSREGQEGLRAFLEKRRPGWSE